jgi:hypothetical protein
MIAIDIDQPLWLLSKHGCTDRDKTTGSCPNFEKCEAKEYCIKGMVRVGNESIWLET